MSNILNLHQDAEDRFNAFVKHGTDRIWSNREFCGLTISDFVDYVVDGDLSGKMLNGLVRTILTMKLSPEVTKLSEITAYQKHFTDLFDRFITKNDSIFRQQFAALQLEAKREAEIDAREFDKISNF